MFARFTSQNINQCPLLIPHTTIHVSLRHTVINQMFVIVVEKKENDLLSCRVCLSNIDLVTCASSRGLTESVLCALKPVVCKQCNTRFANNLSLSSRLKFCNATEVRSVAIKPTLMTVPSLKEALRSRGLSTAGTKEILVKRLEGALAGEG